MGIKCDINLSAFLPSELVMIIGGEGKEEKEMKKRREMVNSLHKWIFALGFENALGMLHLVRDIGE